MIKSCRDCANPVIGRAPQAILCVSCGAAAVARYESLQARLDPMTPKERAHELYLLRKERLNGSK